MTNNPPMPCRDINELLPVARRGAAEFLRRCAARGLAPKITETYRTAAYQNQLYAQGRTAPGSIVTNARGGQSIHEYRLAFDICQNVAGKAYDESKSFTLDGKPADFFQACGRVWQEMGGEWGGAWPSFPDKPHLQYCAGFTDAQIRAGAKIPADAKMPWETAPEPLTAMNTMQLSINNQPPVAIPSVMLGGSNYPNLRLLLDALNNGLGLSVTLSYDAAKRLVELSSKTSSKTAAK